MFTSSERIRYTSIDSLRGLVILLMLLDHTRDFFSSGAFNPRDVHEPAIFMTRWITHICAPTFALLAGVAIFLWEQHHSKREAARFLFTRGIWLIILEITVVKFGWTFNFGPNLFLLQVIWMLGISMTILAALIYLPLKYLIGISVIIIVSHNLLDSITAASSGLPAWVWMLIHQQGMVKPAVDSRVYIIYPIVPWFAVMALGYSMGTLYLKTSETRIRYFLILGTTAIFAFLVLRFFNLYGNPSPWGNQDTFLANVLSFIDVEKYPPSLQFLLMTLGPSLLLLALFEQPRWQSRFLSTYGRVPLFFYVIHIPLIHLTAVIVTFATGNDIGWLFIDPIFNKPEGYGYELFYSYLVCFVLMLILYLLCDRYARFKRRHHSIYWLRYL